jgi:23S rRNA pseudouridine1911/1915/1917 synthase
MGKAFTFVVSEGDGGQRLDRFLQGQNLPLSRSRIKHLVEERQILVNDQPVKPGARVKPGDQIQGQLPAARPLEAKAEDIPLTILYEDPHIIVVNKPAGMVVHPAPGVYSGTLVNALLFHCRDLSGINGVLRPGIVHRLDRYTSGVMVAAKNDLAHESLAKQFKSRQIEKRYLAVVHGSFHEAEGIISASLGRHPKKRTVVSVHTRSPKEALTGWHVLEEFRGFTLLEIFPKTGRTHQIRVHLSSIGHPILGDPVYGRRKHLRRMEDPKARVLAERFQRQALHASDLKFRHPQTGNLLAFHARLAPDMEEIIRLLRGEQDDDRMRRFFA